MPVTSHGWRPISVTIQPASVATQPANVNPAKLQSSQRGVGGFLKTKEPIQARRSISTPMPTITRNAKNIGATGGGSSKSFIPFPSPLRSCTQRRGRGFGAVFAKKVVRFLVVDIGDKASDS